MTTAEDLRADVLRALAPPVRLSLPDWIESNVRLAAGGAMPGSVKLYPTQRGIADAIGDPAIERVTVLKSVRVGYSFLLAATIASFAKNEPSQILAVLPTESDCRDFCISDLNPMIDSSPALRGLLSDDKSRDGRNTITSRRFAGGSLKVVAAASPRNLRRHTARVLLLDEIDAEGFASGHEGSPVLLAERRTLSYRNRKIVAGSTPTNSETGHVLRLYAESDQRVYEIACAECGALAEPKWSQIIWEKGKPETAAWQCPHCEARIPERFKAQMIAGGAWRSLAPHVEGHAGFKLTAITSTLPGAAWPKLAAEFRAAKHPDQLRVFINTLLAEEFREDQGESLDDDLASRVESISLDNIPVECLWLTCGVDVGHDRLDATVMGHDATGEVCVLHHETIYGQPLQPRDESWIALDSLLRKTWPHKLGGNISISATAVDGGDGASTDVVAAFSRPRWNRRCVMVKGDDGERRPFFTESQSQRGRLWICGVDGGKANLLSRLKRKQGVRFSDTLPPTYWDELASERRETKFFKGQPTHRWVRVPGRRAEALDCFLYAWAVKGLVHSDAQRRENELRNIATAPTIPAVIRSKWMQRAGER